MLSLINRFRVDERGATTVEYGMLVIFLAFAVSVAATTFAGDLNDWFTKIGAALIAIPLNP